MTAPIDRIENIRASVEDVHRQMEACRAARIDFGPTLAWRLLSECRSLLEHVERQDAALARVKALHRPETRALVGSGEWSVPLDEWPSDEYDGDPETFEVCAHCGQIEMRESQGGGEHAYYLEAKWPCATIRAIEGENDD